MPLDQRFADLVQLLKEATQAGHMRWEKTPDPWEFKGRFSGGAFRIRFDEGPGVYNPFGGLAHPAAVLTVLEPNGETIEEWKSTDPGEVSTIEELYRLARRSALNTDQKLENVIQDLRDLLGKSR